MPNKDYDNFVARMGSFDDNFDDIFEGIDLNSHIKGVSHMDDNQRALSHFGVPGMKWGVRRSYDSAGILNTKSQQKMKTKAETTLGRKITPQDFGGKITNRGIKNVQQYDEQKSRYNKVRQKGDPFHALNDSKYTRNGVNKLITEMEKGTPYAQAAKKAQRISAGERLVKASLVAAGTVATIQLGNKTGDLLAKALFK